MSNVNVEQIMSTDLVTVNDDAPASAAAARMLEKGVSSILVVDGDCRLEGLLTATDFVRLVRENDPDTVTPIGECMTTDVVTVSPEDTIDDLEALAECEYSHLPVTTDTEEVIGMVSTTDLTMQLTAT